MIGSGDTPAPAGRRRISQDVTALLGGALIAVLLLIWAGTSGYRDDLITTAASYALVALGMYIPFVLAGSLSLAYGAYAGIGGYSVALIGAKSSLPLWVAWFICPVVAAAVAVVLGMATRRLSGFYLAAVTLLFGEAFQAWLGSANGITGGAGGLGNFRPLELGGWQPSRYQLVVVSVVLVLVVAWLLDRMRLSPWGITVRAMREVPQAVEASGIRVPMLNLVALAIGAGVGSLGGALFTSSTGSITPDTFTLSLVFLAIFMPIIGGQGTPWGAVAGAVIVIELTLNLSVVHASGTLLVAAGVLVIMLVAPRGVLGYIDRVRRGLAASVRRGGR